MFVLQLLKFHLTWNQRCCVLSQFCILRIHKIVFKATFNKQLLHRTNLFHIGQSPTLISNTTIKWINLQNELNNCTKRKKSESWRGRIAAPINQFWSCLLSLSFCVYSSQKVHLFCLNLLLRGWKLCDMPQLGIAYIFLLFGCMFGL